MSQYQKECNRCGQKIKMSDELGKWKAFELDGKNVHECKPKQEQVPNGHDVELIESIIQGLQNIIVDLGKLK